MIEIKIDEKEMREIVRRIQALGDQFTSRRQRLNMLRGGANIIMQEIKSKTPVADRELKIGQRVIPIGFTKESVKVKSLRRSNALWVGPKKISGYLAFWLHFLEYGARNRDGSKREGYGFMKKALESKRQEAVNRIIQDAKRLLDRIVQKIAKGGR